MSEALEVLNVALGEVGYEEGPSSNQQKYSPQVPGLEWSNYQPWCQTFQSWIFQEAGHKSLAPVTASCLAAVQWYQDRDRWSWYPAVGAMVLYGPGGGSHVGIVYAFDGTYIYTIEGNTDGTGSAEGDGVYMRQRVRRDDYVYGYGYPAYAEGLLSADPSQGALSSAHMDDLSTPPAPEPDPDPEPDPEAPARETYVVQEGDTVGSIASAFGETVDEIVQWNGLLQVGDTLWVSEQEDAPPPAPTVAQPIAYQDDFEDSLLSETFWDNRSNVTFSNGNAKIKCLSTYAGSMQHDSQWDMTDKYVSLHVNMPGINYGSKEFFFVLEHDASNSFMFIVSGNTLYMRRRQGGTNSNQTLTFDEPNHQFLRLREWDGQIHWDTSPDGLTWTTRRSASYTFPVTSMDLNLFSGWWGSDETASSIVIYEMNVTGAPTNPNPDPDPEPDPEPDPTDPTVFVANVQPGEHNAEVLVVQNALRAEGFTIASSENESFGTETRAAYKAFELSLGYTNPTTPPPTSTTVKLSDVQYGDDNSSVVVVQEALIAEGHTIAAGATGYFGDQTKTAYASFQSSLGYTGTDADGNPGCTSLSELGSRRNFAVTCDVVPPPTGTANSPTTGQISTSSVIFSKNSGIGTSRSIAESYAYQACAKTGMPNTWVTGMSNGANLLTLMSRESNYNFNAVNTYDSNAWGAIQSDGAPYNCSRSACQTIPGTFAWTHEEGTSNRIYEPVANICAAINYMRQQYGGIQNVQQANPNMSPKGY